jgi:hypothetical protein
MWTSHANFPRPAPETYYKDCMERIGDSLRPVTPPHFSPSFCSSREGSSSPAADSRLAAVRRHDAGLGRSGIRLW